MNLLDLAYAAAALVTVPVWARKTRGDWPGRFGHAPQLGAPARPRLLVHAVSVGEVNALRGLVPLLTAHAEVVISVGTDTGIARARELFESQQTPPDRRARVVRYPLDFSRCVRRFLDLVRPHAVALVELEIWPNFVGECRRRGVPVTVINGRLSARSFRGYRRFRFALERTFASLHTAAVQDEAYSRRFIEMGVPPGRCVITDTMKWDAAAIADEVPGAGQLAGELGIDRSRPLIVAGSTGPGEEALLHGACPPGVQLLCAPRKPERFDEAAAALPGCTRRSAAKAMTPARGSDRFLLDTIGELRAAYSLADIVVVGRSFGKLFGSDPIEPIALGKAALIGPRYDDFQVVVRALVAAGGIELAGVDDLPRTLTHLIENPARRTELAQRGRECIRAHRGATQRHADLLLGVLAQVAPAADSRPASPVVQVSPPTGARPADATPG